MSIRLGIFGGTFNPIHHGHLLLAETARERLQLDRLLFVPTGTPPHKRAAGVLPGPDRMALIEAAIRDQPAFVASDIELQRRGVSYTLDTVTALHTQLPMAKLFLIVGQDMLGVTWKGWAALAKMCTIAAAKRPGAAGGKKGVTWLPMPLVELSSSDIRARVAAGRSIKYLVPPAVERLIRERGWYQKTGKGRLDA